MLDWKSFTEDKSLGFWFSAAIIFLSLLTPVLYICFYVGLEQFSWTAFILPLAAAVAGAVLIVFRRYEWLNIALALLNFVALLFFIYTVSHYVSVVLVGIDLDHFEPQFIVCAALYLLTCALGVANVFLKQVKENGGESRA